jgi:hypothetical protein
LLVSPGSPSPRLSLLIVGVLVWNAYWFLLRGVHQLELSQETLRWATPLRSGAVPVAEVQAIRPWILGLHVVATGRGNLVVLFPTPGFDQFAQALQSVQPSVTVQVGATACVTGGRWLPRGAGFYRLDGEG